MMTIETHYGADWSNGTTNGLPCEQYNRAKEGQVMLEHRQTGMDAFLCA